MKKRSGGTGDAFVINLIGLFLIRCVEKGESGCLLT